MIGETATSTKLELGALPTPTTDVSACGKTSENVGICSGEHGCRPYRPSTSPSGVASTGPPPTVERVVEEIVNMLVASFEVLVKWQLVHIHKM